MLNYFSSPFIYKRKKIKHYFLKLQDSTLNRETRRAPRPPVAHAQMAWEDLDKLTVD
jgi:hypothetical protein